MAEENKKLVRRIFEEVFNKGNLDVLPELVAQDYVGHDPALNQDMRGPDGFAQFVRMYRNAFPDLQLTIEDQLAEGDRVCTRFSARGTHRGDLMGIRPTGNKIVISGLSIDRHAGGKTDESWTEYDLFGMLQQLGILRPAPSPREEAEPARPS